MENKKLLTEENYQQTNEKVKKIGNIILIIGATMLGLGIIFMITSFMGIGNQVSNGIEMGQDGINPSGLFSSIGGVALGGFLIVPGFFLLTVGFIVRVVFGHRREIMAYTTQQVMPVAQEEIEKMAPTVGFAVGTIGKELAKGIKEGINEADKNK